ncbi:MAG: hypothetical protein DCC88_12020, partial [Spirobacillus cienkowskii]
MPLTIQNRDNTLNYWWILDEHKNNLINWQRYNTRETLINNRNRVHAERRRLVQLVINEVYDACDWFYRNIQNENLKNSLFKKNSLSKLIPNDNQTLIQLNLPHKAFYDWLMITIEGHADDHYNKNNYSSYLSNFGSIPFLPEYTDHPIINPMPLDNRITVAYTAKIKEDTLNYWWGLEGHKNTLITWQRENNQDVLQTNKNTVHTERLRLI